MKKIALLSLLLLLLANITGCATMKKMMWWESEEDQVEAQTEVVEEEAAEAAEADEVVVVAPSHHPRHKVVMVDGEHKPLPSQPSNVKAAKKTIQDRYVSMTGSVYYDGFAKSYVILDNTGVMPIDLTDEDFAGLTFDKNDVVRATGTIEPAYTAYYPTFTVDYIEVLEVR